MSDVMFVIKCLVVTLVIVVLLQIRVGQRTLEGHTMAWLHHSSVTQHLQDVAEGAVKAGGEAKRDVAGFLGTDQTPPAPEPEAKASHQWFKIKRSAAYHKQVQREQRAQRAQLDEESDITERELREAETPSDDYSVDRHSGF